MEDEEYNKRLQVLIREKEDLEKSINSYELVYPPIDHSKVGAEIIEKIEDLQLEIDIDTLLDSVKRSFWVIDNEGRRVRIRSSEDL
jgi:hypothetical protein